MCGYYRDGCTRCWATRSRMAVVDIHQAGIPTFARARLVLPASFPFERATGHIDRLSWHPRGDVFVGGPHHDGFFRVAPHAHVRGSADHDSFHRGTPHAQIYRNCTHHHGFHGIAPHVHSPPPLPPSAQSPPDPIKLAADSADTLRTDKGYRMGKVCRRRKSLARSRSRASGGRRHCYGRFLKNDHISSETGHTCARRGHWPNTWQGRQFISFALGICPSNPRPQPMAGRTQATFECLFYNQGYIGSTPLKK